MPVRALVNWQEKIPGFEVKLSEHYNDIVLKIRSLEKPVLIAVNGVAAGAGATIALCGDVVVAGFRAFFIQAFSKTGLILIAVARLRCRAWPGFRKQAQ